MRPYRNQQLANSIRVILSEAIAQRLSDPRIAPLTTITQVKVSADGLFAKVFVTVHGAAGIQRRTLAGLCDARGRLQRLLAAQMRVRHCPRISFDIDESFLEAQETLRLMAENRRLRGEDGLEADDVEADESETDEVLSRELDDAASVQDPTEEASG